LSRCPLFWHLLCEIDKYDNILYSLDEQYNPYDDKNKNKKNSTPLPSPLQKCCHVNSGNDEDESDKDLESPEYNQKDYHGSKLQRSSSECVPTDISLVDYPMFSSCNLSIPKKSKASSQELDKDNNIEILSQEFLVDKDNNDNETLSQEFRVDKDNNDNEMNNQMDYSSSTTLSSSSTIQRFQHQSSQLHDDVSIKMLSSQSFNKHDDGSSERLMTPGSVKRIITFDAGSTENFTDKSMSSCDSPFKKTPFLGDSFTENWMTSCDSSTDKSFTGNWMTSCDSSPVINKLLIPCDSSSEDITISCDGSIKNISTLPVSSTEKNFTEKLTTYNSQIKTIFGHVLN
jgi:hypothetical protein